MLIPTDTVTVNCKSHINSSKQKQETLMSGDFEPRHFPGIVSSERICGFRIMTSLYWKIAIFLCPSLADWSRQASIKVKRIMKVNIQMFLPGLGILHRCNYRAHAGMMIGPETRLAWGKLQYIPRYTAITCLWRLRAPPALPKHPSHGKYLLSSSPSQVGDRWARADGHILAPYHDGWRAQW